MSQSEKTNSKELVVPNYNSQDTENDADSDIENGPSTSKKFRGKAKVYDIIIYFDTKEEVENFLQDYNECKWTYLYKRVSGAKCEAKVFILAHSTDKKYTFFELEDVEHNHSIKNSRPNK